MEREELKRKSIVQKRRVQIRQARIKSKVNLQQQRMEQVQIAKSEADTRKQLIQKRQ